jgi:hypothetical protein
MERVSPIPPLSRTIRPSPSQVLMEPIPLRKMAGNLIVDSIAKRVLSLR